MEEIPDTKSESEYMLGTCEFPLTKEELELFKKYAKQNMTALEELLNEK